MSILSGTLIRESLPGLGVMITLEHGISEQQIYARQC